MIYHSVGKRTRDLCCVEKRADEDSEEHFHPQPLSLGPPVGNFGPLHSV